MTGGRGRGPGQGGGRLFAEEMLVGQQLHRPPLLEGGVNWEVAVAGIPGQGG